MSDQNEAGGTSSLPKQVARKASSSFPIFSILTLIFVVGKIMGKLTWPWIWVLAPLWGPYAFVIVIMVLMAAFALGAALIGAILER